MRRKGESNMELTEQEILQDVLIAQKFMLHMYCQFGLECSNPTLRNLFSDLSKASSEQDFKVFKIMNDKGFYPTTVAQTKDVNQAIKMHTQMQSELETKLNEE